MDRIKLSDAVHEAWRMFANNPAANTLSGAGGALIATNTELHETFHQILDTWIITGGRLLGAMVAILSCVHIWITIQRQLYPKIKKSDSTVNGTIDSK